MLLFAIFSMRKTKMQGLGDDLLHFLFDLNQIFRSEGLCVKVVIEAVFNGGADGELCLGMHALYSLSKDMGAGVAHCPAAVGVIKGEELEAVVAMDGAESVCALTVYLCGKGSLAQARAKLK